MKLVKMLGALAALAMALPQGAAAGDYPDKPVRIVVPVAPGGSMDMLSRTVGKYLQDRLGQPVVVENHPGGNSNIGHDLVAKAPADGYTLLVSSDSLAINPSLYKSLNYDPVKSFAPITQAIASPQVLVVKADSPFNTIHDLIGKAKANPGKITIASPGSGSLGHLAGALLQKETGIDLVHVPYKGGGPAVSDLLGGHVDSLFVTLPAAQAHIRSGGLRALAVASPQRWPAFPQVPSVAESIAVPGFDATAWQGFLAPAGTPAAVVERLNREIIDILKKPEVSTLLREQGFEPIGTSPVQLDQTLKTGLVKWAKVVADAKVQVD